jgi:hypothetical protein
VTIDEPLQSVVWRGEPCGCQFLLNVPEDISKTSIHIRVRVFLFKIPVGSLRFTLGITRTPQRTQTLPRLRGAMARRYGRAFLSYASADRPEVLKRAQALSAVGIAFFQDILSLEPGERWERRLNEEIDRCDLFLLFWSNAAARSEWVKREIDFALARQDAVACEEPDITPIILEGPPVPQPIPPRLAHLHFNDQKRYFIAAAEGHQRPSGHLASAESPATDHMQNNTDPRVLLLRRRGADRLAGA